MHCQLLCGAVRRRATAAAVSVQAQLLGTREPVETLLQRLYSHIAVRVLFILQPQVQRQIHDGVVCSGGVLAAAACDVRLQLAVEATVDDALAGHIFGVGDAGVVEVYLVEEKM